jgi:prepilin-type N-terminal cleavage/methylation domain-containing protein
VIKNIRGFTIIELLVVVAIIGILAAVGVSQFSGFTSAAKINAVKANHSNAVKFISVENKVIETEKIELELNGVYANDNDCFLKIAKLPCNINKNIYFHNDALYNLLLNNEILPFIKIRALEQKDKNNIHINIH